MNTHYRHRRKTHITKDHTFCGVVNTAGNLMIGLAVCNPKDAFEKKVGRETAFAHAHTKTLFELVIPEGVYSGHVFHEFVNGYIPNEVYY